MTAAPAFDVHNFRFEQFLHPEGLHTIQLIVCRNCDWSCAVLEGGDYSAVLLKTVLLAHSENCPPKSSPGGNE
jgi:hypothetical protein